MRGHSRVYGGEREREREREERERDIEREREREGGEIEIGERESGG